MAELGYDLSGQWSKGIDQYLGKVFFRYLIIMCAEAEAGCPKVWPGVSERVSWSIEDPTALEGPARRQAEEVPRSPRPDRRTRERLGEEKSNQPYSMSRQLELANSFKSATWRKHG